MVEQLAVNELVPGSSPGRGAGLFSSHTEHMSKGSKILLTANTLWILAEGMLGPLFAIFAEEIGGNILDITSAWAIYLVITGIGIIIVGKISDKVGHALLMVTGFAVTTIFTFGYLLVTSPIELFIVQAGLGLGLALAQPTWMALYDKCSGTGNKDGFIWGLADGFGYLAAAAGILMSGFIVSTYSFEVLFMIMGTIMIISTIYQSRLLFIKK